MAAAHSARARSAPGDFTCSPLGNGFLNDLESSPCGSGALRERRSAGAANDYRWRTSGVAAVLSESAGAGRHGRMLCLKGTEYRLGLGGRKTAARPPHRRRDPRAGTRLGYSRSQTRLMPSFSRASRRPGVGSAPHDHAVSSSTPDREPRPDGCVTDSVTPDSRHRDEHRVEIDRVEGGLACPQTGRRPSGTPGPSACSKEGISQRADHHPGGRTDPVRRQQLHTLEFRELAVFVGRSEAQTSAHRHPR
jgi:hypothetical protein